jgi:propanediol dehydratase small subunit
MSSGHKRIIRPQLANNLSMASEYFDHPYELHVHIWRTIRPQLANNLSTLNELFVPLCSEFFRLGRL